MNFNVVRYYRDETALVILGAIVVYHFVFWLITALRSKIK